jgi:hypothetical protein
LVREGSLGERLSEEEDEAHGRARAENEQGISKLQSGEASFDT